MTIAAIDYGKRRLGIAASDPSGMVVRPAGVIERRSLKRDLIPLLARLRELEATLVIVGLPLNMDGSCGLAARTAQHFAKTLHDASGLQVELYDERLSTFEARQRLKTASKHRYRRGWLDAVAAMVILESWLEAKRRSQ